ncbi:MAG: cytochrome b/b6 domain-containing protein [Chloroflexota bacterium]
MLRGRELWLALIAAVFITGVYAGVVLLTREIPAAGDFFGHSLGIFGFILMLMTETLYSLRKRSRSARWGRMSSWLEFHIFTGLVGPYMTLLHTSWKFNGLAGVVTLFTVIIVVSGFVGRYIYTRIPRSLDGLEIEGTLSQEALKHARRLMALWHTVHIPIGMALFAAAFVHIGAALYYVTFAR